MTGGSGTTRAAAARGLAETLVTALVFAAAGAWPTPDTNEAGYLTKARHAAAPDWGRGDFFLETPDAHGLFFAAFGPLAAALPLDAAAWIGRVLGWLAVAWGFHRVVVPAVSTAWGRLVAAAVFSAALRFTPAAGEWVIGGCEAKVFAWALVLAGVGEVERDRFGPAWCLGGAAAACHPVVGGWGLVATVAAWVACGRWAQAAVAPLRVLAWLAAGGALAAVGVVPAWMLSAGVDAGTRAAGNMIYVCERLPHHLLPRTFAAGLVTRHLLAIVVWWLLARLVPATGARRRLASIVAAAIGMSLVGWVVSLAEPVAPAATYAVLRYYWFRFADVIVPLGLALTVAAVLEDDRLAVLVAPLRPAFLRAAAVGLLVLDLAVESTHWPLPGRSGLHSRADVYVGDAAAWADVCAWVRDHAPADACFLTPLGAASFTWRTGRREVVAWKHSPQDARSLVEWRRRYGDCFSWDGGLVALESSPAAFGPERLREVAVRYGADHAIVPVDTRGRPAPPCPRLYENAVYAVLLLEPLTAGEPPAGRP